MAAAALVVAILEADARFHRERFALYPRSTPTRADQTMLSNALNTIGDPSVAERIMRRLADPSVRDVAAEALGTLGDEDAVPALIEILEAPGVPVGA